MSATLLSLTISWFLAGVFLIAVIHKLRAWPRFKASLAAYQLVPSPLVSAVGMVLVICELVTVTGLVLWQSWGVLLAQAVLFAYALVIAISVLRGRTHIDCGCGDEPVPVSWLLVVRNGVLIGLAATAWRLSQTESPTGGIAVEFEVLSWLVALALSSLAFIMYEAIEQLLANRGRYQRLWIGVS